MSSIPVSYTHLDYDLPIYEGDKVGTLEIYNGKKLEKTIDLVSTSELHSTFAFFTESNFFNVLFKIILFLILAFLLLDVYKRQVCEYFPSDILV